jgi:hypothetical protein
MLLVRAFSTMRDFEKGRRDPRPDSLVASRGALVN